MCPNIEGQREKVVALRKKNPCATLQFIADRCGGISRERVRQILESEELPTRGFKVKQQYECLNCGKPAAHKMFCDRKCQYEYTHPLVECDYCHNYFRRSVAQLTRSNLKHGGSKHYFCNRTCFANAKVAGHKIQLPYEQLLNLYKTGLAYKDICERLGISKSSLYGMLFYLRKRRAIGTRIQSHAPFDRELVKQMYEEGASYKDIAQRLDTTVKSIHKLTFKMRASGQLQKRSRKRND